MKTRMLLLALGLHWTTTLFAETTPLNEPLPEQKEITITCAIPTTLTSTEAPFTSAADRAQAVGTYHYKLWLPKGYSEDPQRRWPCIFIANPSGNATMLRMGPYLKSHGYVVVLLVESKNGPWAPIFGNFIAAHDDVIRRLRIQEGLKFATGFSGGSRASSMFVQLRPGFSGLILQSAGASRPAEIKKNDHLYVAMIFGVNDTVCKGEDKSNQAALGGPRFHLIHFEGGHVWSPQEKFEEAIAWVERQIYEEGAPNPLLRPAYIQRFQAELKRLPEVTAPWERYKLIDSLASSSRKHNIAADPAVAPTLTGLQAEQTKLRNDPAVAREVQAADALRRFEQSRDRTSPTMFTMNCRSLAKQFAGTEAAARAEALAAESH